MVHPFIDMRKSLNELMELSSDMPRDFETSLVERAVKLGNVPLCSLNPGDLRFLLGQRIGVDIIVPLALGYLQSNPLIDSEYYEGDLLWAVLDFHPDMWKPKPEIADRFHDLTERTAALIPQIEDKQFAEELTRRVYRWLHFFHQSAGFSHGASGSSRD